MNEKLTNSAWFLAFLTNVDLSVTHYLKKEVPDAEFRLLEQEISDTRIIRKIGFFCRDTMICKATNILEKNDLVNDWLLENPTVSFGSFFENKNLRRVLLSKNQNSRKYSVSGDLTAEIEETFYPLPA